MINVKPLRMETVTEGCFVLKSETGSECSVIHNTVSEGWTISARKYNKVIRDVDLQGIIEIINAEWKEIVESLFDENEQIKPLGVRQNGKGYVILFSADGVDRFTVIGNQGKVSLYDLDSVTNISHQMKKPDEVIAFAQEIWKERVVKYVE